MTTVAGLEANTLVDGLFHVASWLLGIHHVRDDLGGPLGWDLAFLASGVGLAAAGLAMAQGGPMRNWDPRPPSG